MKTASALLAALLLGSTPSHAAVVFQFDFLPGTSLQAQQGFQAAAARWSALLQDNVTVRLTVGTGALDPGVIGQTGSAANLYDYAGVRSALLADATSAADRSAANSLAPDAVRMLINRTADNPNGAGSATPYLDANFGPNNTSIYLHDAQARALGYSPAPQTLAGCLSTCDGYIEFSNSLPFDYHPGNGIQAGSLDFVGVATHEIGHALGYTSGVDVLDYYAAPANGGPYYADEFTFVTALDLFRYSAASASQGAIDWSADNRDKYFSIDGGASAGPLFATGVYDGDGSQASHWKDNLGIGLMDPTAAYGELLGITEADRMAFDVIGWNLAPVPEPSAWAMLLAGTICLGCARLVGRRRNWTLTAARTSFMMRAF